MNLIILGVAFIDNLLVGTHPDTWLSATKSREGKGFACYDNDRLLFIENDARLVIRQLLDAEQYFQNEYNFQCGRIADVFHFELLLFRHG